MGKWLILLDIKMVAKSPLLLAVLLSSTLIANCYPHMKEKGALGKNVVQLVSDTDKVGLNNIVRPSRPLMDHGEIYTKQAKVNTEKLKKFPLENIARYHGPINSVTNNGISNTKRPLNDAYIERKDQHFMSQEQAYVSSDPFSGSIRKTRKTDTRQKDKRLLRKWNYKVKIKLRILLSNNASQDDAVTKAMTYVSKFFGDKDTSLLALTEYQIKKDILLITWSNSTLDYPLCSYSLIQFMSFQLFDQNGLPRYCFRQAFQPDFHLENASEERNGFCSMESSADFKRVIMEEIIRNSLIYSLKAIKHRYRRNAAASNTPPTVIKTLPTFNVSYCSLFFHPVPQDIFLDQEDGNTRNLTLSLLNGNGTAVGLSSWLQLDQTLQTLYGYLKVSDNSLVDSGRFFHYRLRATDSLGLSVDAPFSVKIPETTPVIFFTFVLKVNSFEDQGKPYVNEAVFLAYKVLSYFEDYYFTSVNILEFMRNHSENHKEETVTFGWTNCTAKGPECPTALIDSLTKRLIMDDGKPNPSFAEKLKPQYTLYDVKAEKMGVCLPMSSSASFQITPSPEYSLSPIIMYPIPDITVYTTRYLHYVVPGNTFYDTVDGYARSLHLELRTSKNATISKSSWIQFEKSTQTIIGILTTDKISGTSYPMIFRYILLATNSRGYSNQLMITLKGYREIISFGALFSMSGRDNSLSTTNDVTILDSTLRKLRSYLNDRRNDTIEVSSFRRLVSGQQKIFSLVYANTTITTSNCAGLGNFLPLLKTGGTLINQDLTVALIPDIVADRVDIARYGTCSPSVNTTIFPSPTNGGVFPVLTNKVPVLSIRTGLYFSYTIPANTFYDANDGDTTRLSLQVTFSNGKTLGHDSWIQFDSTAQNIYGLLPSNQQTVRPFQNFTLLLRVRNSLGYSTLHIITIRSEYQSLGTGIVVTFSGREYNMNQWNDVQLQNFMVNQLREYFGIVSNDTITIVSFQHNSNGGSQFSTLWTDSRIVASECDFVILRDIESKIFQAKETLHPDLIAKMLPNIVLTAAEISYYGKCIRSVTSVLTTISPTPANSLSPQYSTVLPIINATAWLPFSYKIPVGTFNDVVDGNTRSLRLTVSNIDGSSLTTSSPIQFNISSQVLAGIFFDGALHGSTVRDFHYKLIASNSKNFKTAVDLTIRIAANKKKPGIVVVTSANTFYNQVPSNIRISIDFLNLISNYVLNSNINDFYIIALKHTNTNVAQTTVTWSYSNINGSNCNESAVVDFVSMLQRTDSQLNPNFINAMSPTFLVFASSTQRVHSCSNNTYTSIVSSFHITPSASFIIQTMSTIRPSNNPPKVTSQIVPLFAYFCARFSYTVPSDLFHDEEDGSTRKLKLRLETHDRQSVGTSSWLQYSDTSQVLYGIFKLDDYYKKPSGGYKFHLVAKDKQGLEASTEFTVTIPESPLNYNHAITMQLNRIFDDSVPDVNEQLLISTKILEYFRDSKTNSVNIISYKRSTTSRSAVIKWSNCSMSYNPCPRGELSTMLNKIVDSSGVVKSSFRSAMLSHYTIQSLFVDRLYPCNITELTSTIPAFSISPSPSLLPPQPPTIQNPLGQLNISWCQPLKFRIPENMFYDYYGSRTRNLSLTLLLPNGSTLSSQYWLRFDTKTQIIYAYPTLDDLLPYQSSHFLLKATNKHNLTAQQVITVKAANRKPDPNHQLKVTASAYVTTEIADVDIRILIWNKIKTYFKSNATEIISFANYKRSGNSPSQILFTFSNCSLPEDECDKSGQDAMLEKIFAAPGIVSSNFILAFSPEIVVTDVKIEQLGLCTTYVLTPSLSLSSAYALETSTVVASKNQPPLVLQSIGTLKIDPCKIFTYVVPERSFYDVENGLTRNLKLSFTFRNGSTLQNDSWITFNPKTQTLKGIITLRNMNNLQFILTATDNGGLSVSQLITFEVQGLSNPSTFIVNTSLIDYSAKSTSRIEILEYFHSKVSAYLGDSEQIPIQIFSLNRTTNKTLNISWKICRGSCNISTYERIKRKLLVSDNILNPNFVIALGPTLIAREVNIDFVTSCSSSNRLTEMSILPISPFSPTSTYESLVSSSTISLPNVPPIFVKNVPTIQISPCSPFSVKLPENLCYDREDGFEKVTLSVAYRNGTDLTTSSLLQLRKENMTIYGVLKDSDLKPNGQSKEEFLLYCEDTKGLKTSNEFPLNATKPFIGQTYSLTFHAYIYPLSASTNVDIQLLWIKKLQNYLSDRVANFMRFINFERVSSMQIKFSIRLCYFDVCNTTAVQYLRNKIFSTAIPDLNPQFIAAMIPEFSLVSSVFQAPSSILCPISSSIHPASAFSFSQYTSTTIPNNPVRVLKSVPPINITLCSQFINYIPEDTFYDPEDGYTSNLTLALYFENGTSVGSDSWLNYDPSRRVISGYITQDIVPAHSNVIRFKLIATDKHGSTASIPIMINLLPPYKSVLSGFKTEADLYGNFMNNVQIMIEVASKIRRYIGQHMDSGLVYAKFAKYNLIRPKIVFSWSPCSFLESCDPAVLKSISDKLLFSGTILNFEFISALAPNILVTKTQPVNTESCRVTQTQTQTVHTSILPIFSGKSINMISTEAPIFSTPATFSSLAFNTNLLSPSAVFTASIYSSASPSKPFVQNLLMPLTTDFCSFLTFQIPENTFYDVVHGDTRSLAVTAMLEDRSPIPPDYWINFNSSSQMFIGQSKQIDFYNQPASGFRFIVRATNKQNLYAETTIVIKILTYPTPLTHNVTIILEEMLSISLKNLDIISFLRNRISSYFGENSKNDIGILKFQRNKTLSRFTNVTWYNCSLANISCDKWTLNAYFSRMITLNGVVDQQFSEAFLPFFQLRRLQTAISASCYRSSMPLSTSTNAPPSYLSSFSLQTTGYISTPTLSSIMTTSVVDISNTAPSPLRNLTIVVPNCGGIRFKIPNDTFYDKEDGGTSSLRFRLLHSTEVELSCNSTLQLNRTSQEIYGLIPISQLSGSRNILLQAIDKQGLSATTNVELLSPLLPEYATFAFTFSIKKSNLTCTAILLEELTTALGNYLRILNVSILSIVSKTESDHVNITWTDCSAFNAPCNHSLAESIKQHIMINDSFSSDLYRYLLPNIRLQSISMFETEICRIPQTASISINISICDKLNYTLNQSVYGSTVINVHTSQHDTRLTYVIVGTEGSSISWLDLVNGSIIAMPVFDILKNKSRTKLQLRAKYNDKLIRSLEIVLHHPEMIQLKINYTIDMKIISYKSASLSDVTLLESIRRRLENYINVSPIALFIISYNRTRVYPEDIYVSLTPCSELRRCNSTQVGLITRSLSLGNGIPTYEVTRALSPELVLLRLDVKRTGECSRYVPKTNDRYVEIVVSLCTRLYAKMDDNDVKTSLNATNGTEYELLDISGKKVNAHSWVQFDKVNRAIYGTPTQENLKDQPVKGYTFLLRAINRTVEDIKLNVTIIGSKAKVNYTQTMIFQNLERSRKTDAEILEDIYQKFQQFPGNGSSGQIGFISFKRRFDASEMSILEFTNCSLIRKLNFCPVDTADIMASQLLLSNGKPTKAFANVMKSNYSIFKIIEDRTDPCFNTSSKPPHETMLLPQFNLSVCKRLRYRIPNNMFVIPESSNTSSLIIHLKTPLGNFLSSTSWIQFDIRTQTIFGIPTFDTVLSQPKDGYRFLLQAVNSKGASSSMPFNVTLDKNITDRSLINVLVATDLLETAAIVEIQRKFLATSARCLNDSEEQTAIAYYQVNSMSKKQINISIFQNCSKFFGVCDELSANDLFQKLTTNSTINQKYKSCMQPNFTIIEINMSLSKTCKNTTNRPPIASRVIPQLNLTGCEVLHYKVKNDTFFDAEDGKNIMSSIELLRGNGEPLNSSDFVQLNKSSQAIYALYSELQNTLNEYLLKVTDKDGETASTKVIIKLVEQPKNFTYKACLSLRQYSRVVQANIDIIMTISRRIERFLRNGSESRTLAVKNYSISNDYPRHIELCFSNCSFANGECNKEIVDDIKKKIFLRKEVVTQEFRQALEPEFVIMKISDSRSAHCNITPVSSSLSPTTYFSSSMITSSIFSTPIPSCLSDRNSLPRIINSIGSFTVYVGRPVLYEIQSDIAYDKEDGYLRVTMTEINGLEIQRSWIKFNQKEQRIYFSVVETEKDGLRADQYFRLVATDKCGATVYDVLTVKIIGSLSCCYTIQMHSNLAYEEFSGNITRQYQFYRRLLSVYNDTEDHLRLYTIRNESSRYANMTLVYTNSSYTNESCFPYQVKPLSVVAFYPNGTARESFVREFYDFGVFSAAEGNNSLCNGTVIPIIPLIVPPPGTTSALTYNDWLWYILPFIILAFLVVCCCLMFYWCTACRETCCGGKKKDDGLFSAAAAKPIQEEVTMSNAAALFQEEDPSMAAAAAANALPDADTVKAPFDDLYADIAPTEKYSSVPSLHKTKQAPPWMQAAARAQAPVESTPVIPVEEPSIQGAAAMPQEAQPDTTDGPSIGGIAAMPRELSKEDPITATFSPNTKRRPSYLMTPSTSVISLDEEPVTANTATMTQDQPYKSLITEDEIAPVEHGNMETEPDMAPASDPKDPFIYEPVTQQLVNPLESASQPIFEDPTRESGPTLRLPFTPLLAPGEPPPPYSPPKIRKNKVTNLTRPYPLVYLRKKPIMRKNIGTNHVRPLHLQGSRYPRVHEHRNDAGSSVRIGPRRNIFSLGHPKTHHTPKESRLVIRRTLSGPRKRIARPVRSPYRESVFMEISPNLPRKGRTPIERIRQTPSTNYDVESDTDVTYVEEYPPKMPRYGSKDFLQMEEGDDTKEDNNLPVEINGVVRAPENVLMKWLRDGSLKTTITNAEPNANSLYTLTDAEELRVRAPERRRRVERERPKETFHVVARQPKRNKDATKFGPLRRSKRSKLKSFDVSSNTPLYHRDDVSEALASNGRLSERTLKRGYPYSRDPYEYVETVIKPRQKENLEESMVEEGYGGLQIVGKERNERQEKGRNHEIARSAKGLSRGKSKRSINEILARMSRRKELKRERKAFQDDEFYEL